MFSTLSFSGSALFSKLNRGFDVVIIDEAAQAVSHNTLLFYLYIVPDFKLPNKFVTGCTIIKTILAGKAF